jgi:hypothetical protein
LSEIANKDIEKWFACGLLRLLEQGLIYWFFISEGAGINENREICVKEKKNSSVP